MYEGLKDQYVPMKEIFGPVLEKFQHVQDYISHLQLPSPSSDREVCTKSYSLDCNKLLGIYREKC